MKFSTAFPLLLAAGWLATATTAPAQTFSFTGTPALGQNVTLITTGIPGASYLIAVSPNPGPTPFPPVGNLAIGTPLYILVGPGGSTPFLPALGANGQAADVLAIPLSIALYNLTFYFQAAYADSLSPVGLSFTNGISFTIASQLTAPSFTAISPNSGGASGGTPITISGANFLPGPTTVTIGGQPLQNQQVVNAQTITGTTPTGTPNTNANLVITTPGGTVSVGSAFSYLQEVPTITSIAPNHAQIGGGELITVNGLGLGAGTTVYLAGYALVPIVQNAGQIVAFAPPFNQIGSVDAVATSAQGFNLYTDIFRYTILLNTGNGAGGAFHPTANTQINTNASLGVFNFTSVDIPQGVTVTATGTYPLTIRSQGAVTIAGVLNLAGATGTGTPGAGGYAGGTSTTLGGGPGGGYSVPNGCGPCAGYGTPPFALCMINNQAPPQNFGAYGNNQILPLVGGSGGGWSQAGPAIGGGGGGAVLIAAGGDIVISGMIDARGGDGAFSAQSTSGVGAGSGGAIKLQSLGTVSLTGVATVIGGRNTQSGFNAPCGGSGRWFIESWSGVTSYDTTAPIPVGIY